MMRARHMRGACEAHTVRKAGVNGEPWQFINKCRFCSVSLCFGIQAQCTRVWNLALYYGFPRGEVTGVVSPTCLPNMHLVPG